MTDDDTVAKVEQRLSDAVRVRISMSVPKNIRDQWAQGSCKRTYNARLSVWTFVFTITNCITGQTLSAAAEFDNDRIARIANGAFPTMLQDQAIAVARKLINGLLAAPPPKKEPEVKVTLEEAVPELSKIRDKLVPVCEHCGPENREKYPEWLPCPHQEMT